MTSTAMTPNVTATSEPDILDLFAGPGGRDRGAELAGINPKRITGIELDAAAIQTARTARYNRVHCNVLDLDPKDFPHITGLIASTPCPTFSGAGKRTGLSDDYQHVLDVLTHLGADLGCDCTGRRPYLVPDRESPDLNSGVRRRPPGQLPGRGPQRLPGQLPVDRQPVTAVPPGRQRCRSAGGRGASRRGRSLTNLDSDIPQVLVVRNHRFSVL